MKKPTPDKTNSQRQREFVERRKAQGLTRQPVVMPIGKESEVREFAARLVRDHLGALAND